MYHGRGRSSIHSKAELEKKDEDDGDDRDDYDHDSFLAQMMDDLKQSNDEQIRQKAKDLEAEILRKEEEEKAVYGDNNFWRTNDKDKEYDVDELLAELEA